jgi:hypothetical protein
LALELRRGEGESEDVSELAGKVLAVLGERRGEARSAGSARRRRGASAAILGVCAGGGAAWRGRADWGGLGEPGGGEAVWPGRAARGRRPRLGRRRTGEGERKEKVERERDLSDSNLNFSQNFQLTLEKF